MVHELKEEFISLSKIVVSHSTFMKELEKQMGLISTCLDAKTKIDFISGTKANLQAND